MEAYGYERGSEICGDDGGKACIFDYLLSLMTLTTTPNNLTDGMEKLMSPLKKLHVPVHEVSMMMSIALRFIPILLEETDKIMKAQIARGGRLRKRESD